MTVAAEKKSVKKAILAFSGGLDTSFCVPWLKELGYSVITVTVNTGGFSTEDLKEIEARAKELGTAKHYTIDAQNALYDGFASYLIKANYLKGGVYPACVGPERNIIVMELVKIAEKEDTKVIVHGSTGAGNDQVRFDLALKSLIEECEILAPIRDGGYTREDEVAFLKKHGFSVSAKRGTYSINVGLLGTTIGGAETKGTEKELPDDVFPSVLPLDEVKKPAIAFTIGFENGLPVFLDGKKKDGVDLIRWLNGVCSERGFGKDYHIGTTIIGLKARIGFEAPALKVLVKAHTELEKITLTSRQISWKGILGTTYGDLVHEGLYFDPLCRDIEAMLDSASKYVKGSVGVRVHKGTVTITSLKSPYSLLHSKLGTYGERTGSWNGQDAKGFCTLYGMESANAFLGHREAQ
ncbi:argininosuccinate synthase [Candidatus Peregrinibacteria bacterium RIFCSPLOWO2_02_FULL_48_14]|nr:MAG: argininosuccinate synthase [Candidatus Peregrinibacteria bacterium RIFCSPLOWO2_02_FULL_48_14]